MTVNIYYLLTLGRRSETQLFRTGWRVDNVDLDRELAVAANYY